MNNIIPKNIFQYWHNKNDIPEYINEKVKQLKELHPDFNYCLYDEETCIDFIKENFNEQVLYTFISLRPNAYKSDFFRYCILYKYGGAYLDVKYEFINNYSLKDFLEKEYFVFDGPIGSFNIYNAFIVSLPNNSFLLKIIQEIVNNVKNLVYGDSDLYPTGPKLLGTLIDNSYRDNIVMYHEVDNAINKYICYKNNIILKSTNDYYTKIKRVQESYYQLWCERKIYIANFEHILNKTKSFIHNIMLPVITLSNEPLEGNLFMFHQTVHFTDEFKNKQINLVNCVQRENIKNVLEIGFNSGFSALLLLLSNPTIKLTCVDIGEHSYTRPCYAILKEIFGSRVNLLIGNSVDVLSKLVKDKIYYDMIHIDGAHDATIAEQDISNSLKLSKKGTILIMDDTNDNILFNLWQRYTFHLSEIENVYKTMYHDIKIV